MSTILTMIFKGDCTMPDSKKPVYKSSPSKLIAFFKKSRDSWKKKYMDAKLKIKQMSDKVRYWRNKADELKKQVKDLEGQLNKEQKKTRQNPKG
jgi:polyhydroxyalkanoate synthesis regulator phasin